MKKVVSASLLAMALLLLFAAPSLAWTRGHFHGGTRVFVGVGPGWGWWGAPYPYPYYYPPYSYYPYYPYYPQAPAEPPVYVQQEPALSAPPAVSAPAQQGYWYFCASSRQYYPQVSSCSEAWIKVPPRQD
jgi:hypothetical protein